MEPTLMRRGEFEYLASYVKEKGELDRKVSYRIQAGVMNRKKIVV